MQGKLEQLWGIKNSAGKGLKVDDLALIVYYNEMFFDRFQKLKEGLDELRHVTDKLNMVRGSDAIYDYFTHIGRPVSRVKEFLSKPIYYDVKAELYHEA